MNVVFICSVLFWENMNGLTDFYFFASIAEEYVWFVQR